MGHSVFVRCVTDVLILSNFNTVENQLEYKNKQNDMHFAFIIFNYNLFITINNLVLCINIHSKLLD